MTKEFNWLDEADEKKLLNKINEDVKKIIDIAVEEVEGKFKERNIDPQEHEDLFKEYVKEYVDILSDVYTEDVEKTALIQVEKNRKTKIQVREFLPNIENFRFSNTKVENHLAKPEIKLTEILKLEEGKRGFNAELASKADRKEGYSYPVTAKFSLLDNAILPENFNYSSSVRGIVSAIGTAYEYDGLETTVAGTKTIRADHLLSLIDGVSLAKRVTPERVQELVNQIKSLMNVFVEIDIKHHQEYNALKPKNEEGADLQYKKRKRYGPLLSVIVDEYEDFSKDKHFYIEITRLPILYEYAKDAGQMITFDRSLLDLTSYPEHKKPPFPIKRITPQRQALNQMMILESRGRGSSKRFSKYIDITYKRMYDYIEDDLGGYRKESLDKNIEMVADTLIAKGEFSKKEILAKGRKKYGTLRLYR